MLILPSLLFSFECSELNFSFPVKEVTHVLYVTPDVLATIEGKVDFGHVKYLYCEKDVLSNFSYQMKRLQG